jgi:hypothetical protein
VWLVHRQPPASISAQRNGNASGRQPRSTAGFLPWAPSNCACLLEKRRDGCEGFVTLLEYPGKEIEAVRHAVANEVLDRFASRRTQFLPEGAVVINKRVGCAGGDERGRIVAQVGSCGARVRVRPVLTVDEISAADEPDEGGIIDDAKRREALERLVLFEEEIRDRGEQHRGLRRRDAFIARFDHERSGEITARGIASHCNSPPVSAETGAILLHPLQYRKAIIEARRKRPLRRETVIGAHDHHRVFRRDPARDVGGVLRLAEGKAAAVKVEHHRARAAPPASTPAD